VSENGLIIIPPFMPKYFAFGHKYTSKYNKIQTTSTKCQYQAAASKAK